jgi:hypothetical protein
MDSLASWRNFFSNRDRALLTFDDGSRTLLLLALVHRRFSAIQFLVADAIGGANQWGVGRAAKHATLSWTSLKRVSGSLPAKSSAPTRLAILA